MHLASATLSKIIKTQSQMFLNKKHTSTRNIHICYVTAKKHKYNEAEWQHNNDTRHLSGDGELNPPGDLLLSLSVTSPHSTHEPLRRPVNLARETTLGMT